ncbi:hypothetical protein [Actinomycetospora chiangmaiensis]|uniref:hypothetical protein n=1 Tax=Actinomycetospora chiangmaiensis TaxID=402650 RepID=UPI00039E1A91|nr:hypothetical protein [Actinomycetospora chiangmaiensis]
MRLTRIAAATLIAGSLTVAGTGVALADTVVPQTSAGTISAVSEPGVLTLSASSVKAGAQLTFSGTFAEPAASTATGPITVTSPAFAGPAMLTRSNPEAFAGSATVATRAKAGTYTVTASSSAGTVTSRITVVGGAPAPVPAHHGGGTAAGTHSSGHGPTSGTESSTISDTNSTDSTDTTSAAIADPTNSDVLPWVLGGAGAVVLIGGGAYAIGRGRRADRRVPAPQEDARTEVMSRR